MAESTIVGILLLAGFILLLSFLTGRVHGDSGGGCCGDAGGHSGGLGYRNGSRHPGEPDRGLS